MRGSKSGLKNRLCDKVHHLLDIDGDSVHHAHYAANALACPFEKMPEKLFLYISTDFKYTLEFRIALERISDAVQFKYTMLTRFLSHRFLSLYDLSLDTLRIWTPLTLFYDALHC